jgi:hypothetical protein
VLIYDDLLKDRQAFLVKIADYCHASLDMGKIPAKAKHTSYSEKQIRFMQRVSKIIPFKNPHYSKNPIIRFFQRIPVMLYRYSILYTAILVPGKWIGKGPLIPPEALARIREATREDWEKCLDYAGR